MSRLSSGSCSGADFFFRQRWTLREMVTVTRRVATTPTTMPTVAPVESGGGDDAGDEDVGAGASVVEAAVVLVVQVHVRCRDAWPSDDLVSDADDVTSPVSDAVELSSTTVPAESVTVMISVCVTTGIVSELRVRVKGKGRPAGKVSVKRSLVARSTFWPYRPSRDATGKLPTAARLAWRGREMLAEGSRSWLGLRNGT